MKLMSIPSFIFLAALLAAAILYVGCETESATSQLVSVSPVSTQLKSGQSQEFVASGASSYTWRLDNGSYGHLSASTGERVVYTSDYSRGESNNVTDTLIVNGVIDASSSGGVYSAQATIVHVADEVNDLSISPPSGVELSEGESQAFSASGGDGDYTWSIDDDTLGFLSTTSGDNTRFTSQYDPGTNGSEETVLLTVESGDDDYTVSITLQ